MGDYDPRNIEAYYGKTFVIANSNSAYTVTEDGRIMGKPDVEGAKIEMIAGLPVGEGLYREIMVGMIPADSKCKDELKTIIERKGVAPVKGSRLLILLADEATKATKMNGFLTPVIKDVLDSKKK
jgi:hypothetical protein